MKKSITTVLLFARLTIFAQENLIEDLYKRFETTDTIYDDGIIFSSKWYSGYINKENIDDTVFIWLIVNYDIDYNVKVLALGFQSKYNKNYNSLKNIKFELETKNIKFKRCQLSIDSSDPFCYITTRQKLNYENFVSNIKSIKIKNKTYIPDIKHEVFLQYNLSCFEYLKFDWIK